MASFHLRFVGATELPKSFSRFNVDQPFRLGLEDIEAVLAKFSPISASRGGLQPRLLECMPSRRQFIRRERPLQSFEIIDADGSYGSTPGLATPDWVAQNLPFALGCRTAAARVRLQLAN